MLIAEYNLPGMAAGDYEFAVPLDHAQRNGPQITVCARALVSNENKKKDPPWMLYLQGGPGFEAFRPETTMEWMHRVLQEYRILLLDQRGTGRSSPVNHQSLAALPTPQAQADYLKLFRADSIVRDAEFIRQSLIGDRQWSVLGQSFGGFCLAHYLSAAPQGLREALFTGGVPPIHAPIDAVYHATYKRAMQRNRSYYERYPMDVAHIQELAAYVRNNQVLLPGGGLLSVRRLQQLGFSFGFATGFERVHFLLESAFIQGAHGREINFSFLNSLEYLQPFERNPLYALLHEPIYCQRNAAQWSAHRVGAEYPAFAAAPGKPVYFTGEMIYPWMFEEYPRLQPLRETAELLAQYKDWPELYNSDVLGNNTVPCAAVVYYNDMYVERRFSEEAAQTIKGMKVWVTNEYEHDGIRCKGGAILDRLLSMVR